jgi:hypothetical protein
MLLRQATLENFVMATAEIYDQIIVMLMVVSRCRVMDFSNRNSFWKIGSITKIYKDLRKNTQSENKELMTCMFSGLGINFINASKRRKNNSAKSIKQSAKRKTA